MSTGGGDDRITADDEAVWVEALDKLEAKLREKAQADEEAKKEALLDIAAEESS